MTLYICVLFVLLTYCMPGHAFLTSKLALLGGGLSGIGDGFGYSNAYNQGFYTQPVRPVYSSGPAFSGSYGGGNKGQIIKIIKIIEQPQVPTQTYASAYSSGWAPVATPAPVAMPQVVRPVPVAVPQAVSSIQYAAPVPAPIPAPTTLPVSVPVHISVQPATPQLAPIPVQAPLAIQQPIAVPQPQIYSVARPQVQQTYKVIVDKAALNHVPSATYGVPYSSTGASVSTGWNTASWNNLGNGGLKSGGIWKKLDC